MKDVKVSIVTPCLNSRKTIRQTIESILNQTYKNIEYIIVDGQSTDGTLDIIREYIPRFKGRLRYISEKDQGIYSAINKGIRLSRGALIGIINSDDYYEWNTVERVVSCRTDDRYQVLYGYCRVMDHKREIALIKNGHLELEQAMIPHPTCFVTREVYRDFGMFSTAFKISADYEFMLRLHTGRKVVFTQIREILATFRAGGASYNFKRCTLETIAIKYRYGIYSLREALIKLMRLYFYEEYE